MNRKLRARAERFGAMVAIEDPPALVAIDRKLAREIGIEGGALWEGENPGLDVESFTAPNEVHVAVTDRCPHACTGCYADALPDGAEPGFDTIAARLEMLASMGVLRVAFGGGEALMRRDLSAIANEARRLGITPTITTSGIGLSASRAKELAAFAQVNVSYDGATAVYRSVRGFDGATHAERAMDALREAGVAFGVNVVLTRASFEALDETLDRARSFGAREAQLLRFKPSGRGRLDYLAQRLSETQIARFPETIERLSIASEMMVRIDCALVPFLVADGRVRAEELVRFGVMGCEAARSLLATKSDGSCAPCSFWSRGGRDASSEAWSSDETLLEFRDYARRAPEPCASCEYRPTCRSGCRIVAGHLTGNPYAPDPECPRVRSFCAASTRPSLD